MAPRKFTSAQVVKFYNDIRTGKYKGKSVLRRKLERAFFRAARTGNIKK